jgi:hypothetical protein
VIPVVDPATEEVITEIADGTVAEATTAVGWHTRRRTPGPGSAPARAARSCVVPFDLMTERRRPWLGSSCSKRESASGRTERGRVRRGVLSLVRQGGRPPGRHDRAHSSGTNKIMVCASRSASRSSSRRRISGPPWPPDKIGPTLVGIHHNHAVSVQPRGGRRGCLPPALAASAPPEHNFAGQGRLVLAGAQRLASAATTPALTPSAGTWNGTTSHSQAPIPVLSRPGRGVVSVADSEGGRGLLCMLALATCLQHRVS